MHALSSELGHKKTAHLWNDVLNQDKFIIHLTVMNVIAWQPQRTGCPLRVVLRGMQVFQELHSAQAAMPGIEGVAKCFVLHTDI